MSLRSKTREESVAMDEIDDKPSIPTEAIADEQLPNVEEKPLIRRIDYRLMPLLFITYILQFLDKTSLNTAAILGIIQETKLVGQEFPWLNSAFYFGYLVANYPVSILLVKLPIAKFLSGSIIIWAIILGCHAACHNFVALCVLRVLLGAFEATISPGFNLITGMWYKPSEHVSRHGIWFIGNSMGGLCGNLIAFACTFITGGPLSAWRWLFILLGVVTLIWGAVLLVWLPDSPASARFLTPEQRIWATQRPQQNQRSFKTNQWSHRQFVEALIDPKSWFQFSIMAIASLSNGVISNFNSLIIKGLGFDNRQTLLLGVPLSCFILVVILASVYLTQRFRKSRLVVVVGGQVLAFVGTVIIRELPQTNKAGRYIGVILLTASTNIFPLMLSLISTNVAGFTKKATVNAMFFVGYCVGNIAGPQFFKPSEAPNYTTAFTSLFIIYCVVGGLAIAFRQYLAWENRRRDKAQGVCIDPESPQGDVASPQRIEEVDETDWENQNFRYHL